MGHVIKLDLNNECDLYNGKYGNVVAHIHKLHSSKLQLSKLKSNAENSKQGHDQQCKTRSTSILFLKQRNERLIESIDLDGSMGHSMTMILDLESSRSRPQNPATVVRVRQGGPHLIMKEGRNQTRQQAAIESNTAVAKNPASFGMSKSHPTVR
ncbi:hypothetical protein ACLOJK_019425 [Asimina triloba]